MIGMRTLLDIKQSKIVNGPVRKIGIQSRSITGTMPNGNRYESSLERDFMILLDYDYRVKILTPQPITIPYQDSQGIWHRYTPDALVEYYEDLSMFDCKPTLVEVKYRNEFDGQFLNWLPKYRAANKYAHSQGWKFEILTEEDIRIPALSNIKFLNAYKNVHDAYISLSLDDHLADVAETTPLKIISSIYKDKWNQAHLLPIIWGIIARREVNCDLNEKLTMHSRIWKI